MSNDIIWCGGEDIDFNGSVSLGNRAYSYGRCSIKATSGIVDSVTAFTMPNPIYISGYTGSSYGGPTDKYFGLVKKDSLGKGIWVGVNGYSDQSTKFAIYKYNGSTWAVLASESGYSGTDTSHRVVMSITNFGNNCVIVVSCDGTEIINATVDASITGITELDAVGIASGCYVGVSELFVADYDIRGCVCKNLSLNAAGDVNEMDAGVYSDINEVAVNDATQIYTATTDKKFLANCTGMPSGDWVVKAVKIAARCADGLGTLGAKLGIKSGGTEDFEATPQNCSGYWQTKERLMNVNPVTGVAFTPAEIEAIQIGVESGTV